MIAAEGNGEDPTFKASERGRAGVKRLKAVKKKTRMKNHWRRESLSTTPPRPPTKAPRIIIIGSHPASRVICTGGRCTSSPGAPCGWWTAAKDGNTEKAQLRLRRQPLGASETLRRERFCACLVDGGAAGRGRVRLFGAI